MSTLKIDRSFVTRLHDANDREIVRIITELAGILKLKVIAEGVETREDLLALREIGCGYGQGFLFDKPLNAERAQELILENRQWL